MCIKTVIKTEFTNSPQTKTKEVIQTLRSNRCLVAQFIYNIFPFQREVKKTNMTLREEKNQQVCSLNYMISKIKYTNQGEIGPYR